MKKILCFFMIVSIMIITAGCSLQDKPLKLSYDLDSEPRNLDPQTAKDTASLIIINNVFEGLFAIDKDGKLANGMVDQYTVSNDGLTYTFNLRKDAKWNDNIDKTTDKSVTAHDFEFAFQRLLNKDTNSPYADMYYCIKNAKPVQQGIMDVSLLGVHATDDFTLQINLEYKNDNFLNLLSATCTMPCNKEYFTNTNGKYGLEAYTIVSNGPFIISSWQHDKTVKLKKSESYYNQANVQPKLINLLIDTREKKGIEGKAEEVSTVQRLLDENTLAGFVDGFDIEKLNKKAFNSEPIETSTWGIVFNQNHKELKNRNVRLAIATAFDRNTYKDELPDSLAVANAIIPNGVLLDKMSYRKFAGDQMTQAYDAKKAFSYYQTALLELDQKKINGIKILMPENADINHSEYFLFPSQILQRDLGVFISVEQVDQEEYEKRLKNGEFDCALLNAEVVNNSMRSVLDQFESTNDKNYFNYNNQQVDMLLKQTATQTDNALVNQGYKEIEQTLIDDAIFIPMYYKTDYFVVSQSVKGLGYHRQTGLISFKDVKRN